MPVYETLASEACPPEPSAGELDGANAGAPYRAVLRLLLLLLDFYGAEEFLRILRGARAAVNGVPADEDTGQEDGGAADSESDSEPPEDESSEADPTMKPMSGEPSRE
jgi:hypothetical protein